MTRKELVAELVAKLTAPVPASGGKAWKTERVDCAFGVASATFWTPVREERSRSLEGGAS